MQAEPLAARSQPHTGLSRLAQAPTSYAPQDIQDDDDGEQEEEDEHEDDSRSVVGVSIGPLQRQLTSSTVTPAQKDRALHSSHGRDGDPFDDFQPADDDEEPDLSDEEDNDNGSVRTRRNTVTVARDYATVGALPSPRIVLPSGSIPSQRYREQDGQEPRKPAKRFSLTVGQDQDQGLRKYIPSLSLPKSLTPKTTLPSIGSALSWLSFTDSDKDGSSSRNNKSNRSSVFYQSGESTPIGHLSPDRITRPDPVLRRTTSDNALNLQRSLSRASSLGDDDRWVDVHEQVNSRMKAIKDSLADSNFKMPKLPNITSAFDKRLPRARSKTMVSERNRVDSMPPRTAAYAQKVQPPLMSPPLGMSKASAAAHPHFTKALHHLTGDVVILGGYRGSILRSAEPPNRQLWVPVKVGLNIRKVNLEVGLDIEDEEKMTDNIIPSGMLKNIGPVDISRRLFKRLQSSKNAQEGRLRIWDFGYDWRLSPLLLSRHLSEFLAQLPSNQPDAPEKERGAFVVAHSLGGLITRHVVNQHPKLFRGVIYAGVPQHCVNILGPLRNGDEVLLSSRVLTAQVNFTIRTSYALLPLDGKCFIDTDTGERYDVDFFDVKTWEEYRLSPCIARPYTVKDTSRGLVGSMASVFTRPVRRNSSPNQNQSRERRSDSPGSGPGSGTGTPSRIHAIEGTGRHHAMGPQMDHLEAPDEHGQNPETNVSTAVTIPRDKAVEYLTRTLAEVKRFKQELAYKPEFAEQSLYCPISCIYGKSIPTVVGANVRGREGIKYSDAYDDLAFASGDGVVLARAAQVPEGYRVVKGGCVSSDRGHVSLLGDLEAVGRCFLAMLAEGRRREKEKELQKTA